MKTNKLDRVQQQDEKPTATFWPHQVFVEGLAMLLVATVLILMAIFLVIPHETVARPADTTFVPRPEWYFLFLFEMLKYFPGKLEVVGVVFVPTIVIIIMILLPFFDRSEERRPLHRPIATGVALVGIVFVVFMTGKAMSGTSPSVTSPAALISLGKQEFQQQGCSSCHAINGVGGNVGPDLAGISEKQTLSWVHIYIEDPSKVNPTSQMPGFMNTLSQDQIEGLAMYLMSIPKESPPPASLPPGATPTPVPETTLTPAPSGETPPAIPHTLEGRVGICLSCHQTGVGGAPKVPQFHIDNNFTNDMCLSCHKPASQATSTPAPTPVVTVTPVPTPGVAAVSFSADVQPIFNQYCTTCHGAAVLGGLNLTSYSNLTASNVVQPGNAGGSKLYQRINGTGGAQMPPGAKLPADAIAKIGSWINQGAQNN